MATLKRDNIQELIRVLDAAPEERFDMSRLSQRSHRGMIRCLVGWCVVDQWMQENTNLLDEFQVLPEAFDGDVRPRTVYWLASFAIEFGLDVNQAGALCCPPFGVDVTKAQVRANLEALLEGRPMTPYDQETKP